MRYIILMALLVGSSAFAGTTGNVTITGTVAQNVSITVTPATTDTFALTTAQTNTIVAAVNEYSNDANGYKVTLASNNAGVLKNGTLGSVVYTAQYNAVGVTLSVTPQTITSVTSQTAVVSANKNITVSTTAQTSLMQGNYTDTLVFTISAN